MIILRKIIRGIDTLSKYAGLTARWHDYVWWSTVYSGMVLLSFD